MSDTRDPESDQVAPTPNDQPSCHDLAIQDMQERKEFGLRKYNSLLQPFNGRSFLQDIYEELMDATVYVRGKLEEGKQTQASIAQVIFDHVEDVKGYTMPTLSQDFINGYMHALYLIQRDANFIAAKVVENR